VGVFPKSKIIWERVALPVYWSYELLPAELTIPFNEEELLLPLDSGLILL
jgi:hypothetical protein